MLPLLLIAVGCTLRETRETPDAGPTTTSARAVAGTSPKPGLKASASPAPSAAAAPASKPATRAPSKLDKFAGFSQDGKRFAYVVPFDMWGEEPFYVVRGKVGDVSSAKEPEGLGKEDLAGVVAKLKKEGFSTDRRPAAPDIVLAATLTSSPPKLALVRGAARVEVPMGKRPPFAATDVAEIWGVSADGKTAAIHIGSPPGTYKGAPDGLHAVILSPLP